LRHRRHVLRLRQRNRAHPAQMLGHELTVQHGVARLAQCRDQPRQRHLAGIGCAAEHAFPAKHAVERHPVQPADQLAVLPAFDRMRVTGPVQRVVARFDAVADPAFGMLFARQGALGDHGGEGVIAGHAEAVLPQRLSQALRHAEPAKRDDRALARLDPVDFRVVPVVGHGEYPAAIGAQQQFDRNQREVGGMHRAALYHFPIASDIRLAK